MSSNDKKTEGLLSIVFWGCMVLCAIFKQYSTTIFVVGITFIVICLLLLHYQNEKCPHGIYKGKTIQNSVCRCPKCQEEKEKQKQENEEKERMLEEEKYHKEQYKKSYNAAVKIKKDILLSNSSIIASLTPNQFEDYVAQLLKKLGFKNVKQTPYTNDGGKDIICSKNTITYYVECKHYKMDNKVSRPQLQKLFAAMKENGVNDGIFITTSTFTAEAKEYGKKNHIRTIDGNYLLSIVSELSRNEKYPEEYILPCPICGETVVFLYKDKPSTIKCSNGHSVDSIQGVELFQHYIKHKAYSGKYHY